MIFLRFILMLVVMVIGAKLATVFSLPDANVLLKLAYGVAWGAVTCFVLLYRLSPKGTVAEEVEVELNDEDIEELLLESVNIPPPPTKSESLRAVRG